MKIYPGPFGWGWVKLAELSKIIGQSPESVWRRFYGLSKDIVYGILAWTSDLKEVHQDGQDPDDFHSVYVPAGWAKDVLFAHRLGAVRVELVCHEHKDYLDPCPDGSLSCHFNGTNFVSAVGIKADGRPVRFNLRPPLETEMGCCPECLKEGTILPGHFLCTLPSKEGRKALEEGKAYLFFKEEVGWLIVYSD